MKIVMILLINLPKSRHCRSSRPHHRVKLNKSENSDKYLDLVKEVKKTK